MAIEAQSWRYGLSQVEGYLALQCFVSTCHFTSFLGPGITFRLCTRCFHLHCASQHCASVYMYSVAYTHLCKGTVQTGHEWLTGVVVGLFCHAGCLFTSSIEGTPTCLVTFEERSQTMLSGSAFWMASTLRTKGRSQSARCWT
jgi:hypothetical protein